jgi:hypothetical protein
MSKSEQIFTYSVETQNLLRAISFKMFRSQGKNFIFNLVNKNYNALTIDPKKFCIEVTSITHDRLITKITIHLKCTGNLLRQFEENDVFSEFSLIFSSDDFTEPDYSPVIYLHDFNSKYFGNTELFLGKYYETRTNLSIQNVTWSAQQYEDFYNEISAPFIFILLEN